MDRRGISEVAGTMILIGVVVIGMMIVNLVIISTPTNTRIPSLQASMTNRSTLITIVHQGGDSIPAGQYKILVDGNDTTSLFTNSGTSPWSLGETLSYNAPSMPQKAVMIYNGTGKGEVVILETRFPWGVYVPPVPGGSGGYGGVGLGSTPTPIYFPWYDCNWSYRKNITIDHTRVPASQTNFPVLVSLSSDGQLYAHARSDGNDILFTTSDGLTRIPHEIESYSSGTLVAWVNVPSLNSSADTTIMMYYGNSGASSQQNPTDVWSNGFTGVWHLNETAGGSNAIRDSTSNGNHATNVNNPTLNANGKIDGSIDFSGGTDFVRVENEAPFDITNAVTVSAWIRVDAFTDAWQAIVTKGDTAYRIHRYNTNNQLTWDINTVAGTKYVVGSRNVNDGALHYAVATFNNSYSVLYVDGATDGTPLSFASTTLSTNDYNVRIGENAEATGREWNGIIDEVRISGSARSAQWIATEYANQNSPSTFSTVGTQLGAPPACGGTTPTPTPTPIEGLPWYDCSWGYRKNITIDHTKVSGTQTGFPVLVSLAADAGLSSHAQGDGDDILFTDTAGAKLPHEIESYSAGTLVAWVKVPSVSSAADTTIVMYYGNSGASSQQNSWGVWDNNYKGVWHLDEAVTDNGSSGGAHKDSTENGNDGDQYNNNDVTGKIGTGQDFEGDARDEYVEIPNSGTMENLQEGDYTLEGWFSSDTTPPGTPPAWNAYYQIMGKEGYNLGLELINSRQVNMNHWIASGPTQYGGTSGVKNNLQWYHVVSVVNKTTGSVKLYINGANEMTSSFTAGSAALEYGTTPWRIGIWAPGRWNWGGPMNGKIDEVRVSSTARSAQWIATEFNNQDSPSTFYSVGSEEGSTCGGLTVFNTCDWALRKKITIDHTKVAGTQTNFPVLISLASDTDLADDAQDDGDDLVFTSSDGTTQLSHEIESFSGSTGALTAWVKVPAISSASNTDIYLYYGNSWASNQQDPAGVWDSNYVGVWHMKESGSGAQGEFKDSTSYANHGQGGDGNSLYVPAQIAGKIGYAQNFSNVNGKYDFIDMGQNTVLDISGNQITLEAWVQHEVTSNPPYGHGGNSYGILNHKGWYDGYRIAMEGDDTQCTYSGSFCVDFQLTGDDGYRAQSSTTLTADTWYHVAATYNGSWMAVFINGQAAPNMDAKSNAIDPSGVGEKDVWVGHGDMPYDVGWSTEWVGKLDEVRISTLGRSDSWIMTEYNNMNSPSTFSSIGSEEASPCGTPTPTPTYPWYDCNWQERKKITIDHTKVSGDQANFPVLVSLSSDSGLSSYAQNDGDDILFTSSDGTTKLSHEIESYTGGTGALTAWVKVPSLSSSTDTVLYLYYGNSGASSQQDVTNVWESNYKGVWHLKETSGTTIGDSASSANTGTASGGPTLAAAGKIGNAISFDGSNDYIYTTNSENNPQNFTYEAWVKFTGEDNGAPIIDFESSRTGEGSGSWDRNIYYGYGDGKIYFQVGQSGAQVAVSTSAYYDSNWHHVVGVHNSSNNYFYLYVDGVLVGSNTFGTPGQNFVGYWRIGSYKTDFQPGGRGAICPCGYLSAVIDEVRISTMARSAQWIATEYANQNSPSTFFSLAGEESAPCTPIPTTVTTTPTVTQTPSVPWFNCYWPYRKNITIDKARVAGTQADFPVLVNLTSDTDLRDHARSDGYDILFTTSDGQTEIPYERESYTSATGALNAWVKVPQIQSSANTTIYMYYGFLSSPDKSKPQDVWDSNYKGVWHLSSNFNDSTFNNNYGTNSGSTPTTGQMGNARYFDGKGYITINGLLGSPATATVSGWANLVSRGTNGAEVFSIGDNVAVRMDDTFQGGTGADGIYHNSTLWSSTTFTNSGNPIAGTGWHYLTYVANPSGSSQIIYVDGVARKTTTFTAAIVYNQGANTFVGKHGNGLNTYNFTGTIDEIRLSKVTRDANWISTEYKNQANPALFHYIGPEEAFFCGGTSGPSYVQSRSLHFEYVNQASITLPGSTTAGDLLVLSVVINQSNSVAGGGVSDSKNGYAYNIIQTTNVGTWGKVITYNVPNSLGGPGPITATVTLQSAANMTFDLFFLEYSGVASTSPVDVFSSGSASSGTAMNSGDKPITKAPALIYGFGAGNSSCHAATPYTDRETANGRCAVDQTVFMTGTFNVTATQGISGNWALQMAAFKGA